MFEVVALLADEVDDGDKCGAIIKEVSDAGWLLCSSLDFYSQLFKISIISMNVESLISPDLLLVILYSQLVQNLKLIH